MNCNVAEEHARRVFKTKEFDSAYRGAWDVYGEAAAVEKAADSASDEARNRMISFSRYMMHRFGEVERKEFDNIREARRTARESVDTSRIYCKVAEAAVEAISSSGESTRIAVLTSISALSYAIEASNIARSFNEAASGPPLSLSPIGGYIEAEVNACIRNITKAIDNTTENYVENDLEAPLRSFIEETLPKKSKKQESGSTWMSKLWGKI